MVFKIIVFVLAYGGLFAAAVLLAISKDCQHPKFAKSMGIACFVLGLIGVILFAVVCSPYSAVAGSNNIIFDWTALQLTGALP